MAKRLYVDGTTSELIVENGDSQQRYPKGSVRRDIDGDRFTVYYLTGELLERGQFSDFTDNADTPYANIGALVTATDGAFS
jgi:hypothetical protein